MRVLLVILFFCVTVSAQVSNQTAKKIVGTNTLPATCTAGTNPQVYIDTNAPAAERFYICTSTNTWTLQTGGASGSVTSIATTSPITGGTITTTGTIACPTCTTSAASLTSTALVTGAGSQALQTPAATATMDASGNISTPGTVTTGAGGSVAGNVGLGQGTATSVAANTIQLQAPTSVTGYNIVFPSSASTGFILNTESSNVITQTIIGSTGTGNVVRATSPTIADLTVTGSCTGCGAGVNTSGVLPYSNGTAFVDSPLARVDADTVEQKRSTNSQTFYVYDTYTSGSNYRRVKYGAGGVYKEAAGAGSDDSDLFIRNAINGNLSLGTQNTTHWQIQSSVTGTYGALIPVSGNWNIGSASSAVGTITSNNYATGSNCADSAGAAACGAASAGSVVIDAAATSVVVSTTAVTANSQIFIQEDSSLSTRLSVTCNTTISRQYVVTARTAGTSFTITTSAAPVTNPACLSFRILN